MRQVFYALPATLVANVLATPIMTLRCVEMAKKEKIEHSEFSGEFEDDGVTVLVDIHRPAGTQEDWTLEVISEEDDVTTWDERFATDKDAWEEFLACCEKDGIHSFVGDEEGFEDESSIH
jgi:hypothetical protein